MLLRFDASINTRVVNSLHVIITLTSMLNQKVEIKNRIGETSTKVTIKI